MQNFVTWHASADDNSQPLDDHSLIPTNLLVRAVYGGNWSINYLHKWGQI